MPGRSRYSKEELESLFFPCLFHLKAKIVFQGRARVLCGAFEARLGQQQGWGPSLLPAVPHLLLVPNHHKPLEHWALGIGAATGGAGSPAPLPRLPHTISYLFKGSSCLWGSEAAAILGMT